MCFSSVILTLFSFFLSISHAQTGSKSFTLPNTLTDAGSRADGYSIWHSGPTSSKWPIIFAAVPPQIDLVYNKNNPSIDSDPNTYTWTFSPSPGSPPAPLPCTLRGLPYQSPCQDRVVEFTFSGEGQFNVQCNVARNGKPIAVLVTNVVLSGTMVTKSRAIRREYRDIHLEDWSRFTTGANALMALRIWDHMSLIHANTFLNTSGGMPGPSPRTSAHSSPAFLTWHRAYILMFERLFQKILGDENYGLPYWDWTLDSSGGQFDTYPTNHPNIDWLRNFRPSPSSPIPLFTDRYIGPNGDPSRNNAVPTGPFCASSSGSNTSCQYNWVYPSNFNLTSNMIQRQIGSSTIGALPTEEQVSKLLALRSYDVAPFDSKFPEQYAGNALVGFRPALEGWAGGPFGKMHNGVHQWVGGTMLNVRYSILDPVFLLHHNNVERLFYTWQKQAGCQGVDCYRPRSQDLQGMEKTPGVVATPNGLRLRGHMLDDEMHPWQITHSMVWTADGAVSNYDYEQPKVPGTLPKQSTGDVSDGTTNTHDPRVGSTKFDRPSSTSRSIITSWYPYVIIVQCIGIVLISTVI